MSSPQLIKSTTTKQCSWYSAQFGEAADSTDSLTYGKQDHKLHHLSQS